MKNNELNNKEEKRKFNVSNVVTYATFICTVTVVMQKLAEYIRWTASSLVYGTNIGLYQYSETYLFYNLLVLLVYGVTALPIGLYIEQLRLNFSKNESVINNKGARLNFMYICLFSLFISIIITVADGVGYTVGEILIYTFIKFLSLAIISILIAYSAKNIPDDSIDWPVFKKGMSAEKILTLIIKIITYICVALIVTMSVIWICSYTSLKIQNKFYVIDNNKVVVYTTPDYYIVLDCEIKDGNIILYRGNQTKINTTDVYTTLRKFDNVKYE